ncbi:MAG TPA: CsgG/HfaB family protein [Deltaproteobacteria bacterium]|jgi:curli biogenesis system outer membrane secretion channel CsgG|nr:CsgG/HfaB family protein [Deltaproteobacteria bacterium]HQI00919.1 CsgG/HfaB family protein [Deltaproteobacteria bacterium]HQJ09602.1 CsgG/HfaB family protein [Deltaproteobacteria bacterium]
MKPAFLFLYILAALSGCAALNKGEPAEPSADAAVAVWDLEDLSYGPAPFPDMSEMLSGQIIETVRQKGEHEVIERQKLLMVLEEQRIGSSSLADEGTKLRLGKLSGARLMIFGAYQVAGKTMRMDLRLVDVETGRILKTSEKTAGAFDLNGWLSAASHAAEELF